jgi:hypothetical protein
MANRRKLPSREHVFITSLMYHGFRLTQRRRNFKFKRGYIITATSREDAEGIDVWVKMPKDDRLLPVQVTQRGVRMYRKYRRPDGDKLETFIVKSERRVKAKQRRCFKHGIAFVLVRDFEGKTTNPQIAWGDIKALRYAIAHLKRWL